MAGGDRSPSDRVGQDHDRAAPRRALEFRAACHLRPSSREPMEKKFTSSDLPLDQLLSEAKLGRVQLPDFQRGWVWDDDHITSLLASISLSYPIGAVMTLQTGNPDVKFRPRPLEGVELASSVEPETLLLDGQQRATSLYLALKAQKPVPTRDAKGKQLLRRYYAAMQSCIDPNADREEAIVSVPADGQVKGFGGALLLDVSTRDREISQEMFPLDVVFDASELAGWQLKYLKDGPGDSETRFDTWMAFDEMVIKPFTQYQIPTIQLVKATPKEAVCQVFEKVNTGGVTLNVFELLTATYAAEEFSLRDDWAMRRARFDKHAVLAKFDATAFLQIVTLLATKERRELHLAQAPGDEKAPAVSCKRREMLRLELAAFQQWADTATEAVERSVPFLHSEHIFDADDLPYSTQLVPLAAVLSVLGDEGESHGARQLLGQWFWCGVLGEMYHGATETRFALDLQDVVSWVRGDSEEPRTVRDAQFQAERLLTLRTKNSAAYKGLYALQMKRGARDFRTGATIDVHAYMDDAIDIHHIFPRDWCASHGISDELANCIVNKTPIDAHTNRRIGARAPSAYLTAIESQAKTDPDALDEILRSHEIDSAALRQDDFPSFFNSRFARLLKQIEGAMGKAPNRAADKNESPFADPEREPEILKERVQTLLAHGEGKVIEFKATGRKNLHTGERDQKIEWSVIKSLAGFANASGGTLLVGIADDRGTVGIEQDFPLLHKPDRDGWSLWLTDAVSVALGKVTAAEMDLKYCEIEGCTVALIEIGPAASPVFAKPGKGGDKSVFLVRVNSSTQQLDGQDALDYQLHRWSA
jgi:hypothetical protein